MSEAPLTHSQSATGRRGAVASPQFLASEAGLSILRAGGSAVDAALATNAALAVVAAHSCGLGGDAFWLIWDGSRVHALNGSGAAGSAATLEAASAAGLSEMPSRGPWTVTVPGAIASWGEAHARFGRLPWADLLAPAIELAHGFPASPGWMNAVERSAGVFGADSDWARTFRPHGRPWLAGERVSLPALAGTLRRLATEGPAAAYQGELAHRASDYLAAAGSPLRYDDFAGHRSEWTEPISIGYHGLTSVSSPPNSSGVTALELLGVLDRLAWSPEAARWIDLALRAAQAALADREMYLTDPRSMPSGALEALLDPGRLDALADRIAGAAERRVPLDGGPAPAGDTVFLATVDGNGQLVSLIESNYGGFGSGLVDPQTGVGYQNRGASFRLDPAHANALEPGKRPAHTLTPGMLLRDGRPWIAHGSMGGAIQPQVFAQFVSAVVDGEASIADAIARPRWSLGSPYQVLPQQGITLEGRFPAAVVAGLAARGHVVSTIEAYSSTMGHAQAVELRPDGTLGAASDPRVEGAARAW